MAEEWRPVTGFEGAYEVSSQGRVRSLERLDAAGSRRSGRLLKTGVDRKGYRHVVLSRGDKRFTRRVHALVLTAFTQPRPEGMVCRHLNGDPADNRLTNLAWGTPVENMADKARHGRVVVLRGSTNKWAKLTEHSVREMRRERSAGVSYSELARRYGVSKGVARRAVTGAAWAHVA